MKQPWLLKSGTIWAALLLSFTTTALILSFAPGGMSSLNKRRGELQSFKMNLHALSKQNRELAQEIHRLSVQDGEHMESLVRRMGYDRPGEVVYVFGDPPTQP